jgi:hypothetical protein
MSDAKLRTLSQLSAADRKAVWRQLWTMPADAITLGWESDEIPEAVSALGRTLGVKLTAAEVAQVIELG